MPASLYPQVKVVLSCIATQAPGHSAQGWESIQLGLFRAVPGTVTAPHCVCLMRGPHLCAACSGSSPGDLVEGGSAPLSREWSQRWPLAWQRTIKCLLIKGGHRSTTGVVWARHCAQSGNAEDFLAQQCARTLEKGQSGPAGTLGDKALQHALHSCAASLGNAAGAALWQAACSIQSCTPCWVGPHGTPSHL